LGEEFSSSIKTRINNVNSEIKRTPFKNKGDNNNNNDFKIKNSDSDSVFYEADDIPEERVREYYWNRYASYFYRGKHLNERFVGEHLIVCSEDLNQ
jgi:hypothetical protein